MFDSLRNTESNPRDHRRSVVDGSQSRGPRNCTATRPSPYGPRPDSQRCTDCEYPVSKAFGMPTRRKCVFRWNYSTFRIKGLTTPDRRSQSLQAEFAQCDHSAHLRQQPSSLTTRVQTERKFCTHYPAFCGAQEGPCCGDNRDRSFRVRQVSIVQPEHREDGVSCHINNERSGRTR
ncbi:MAG: hypothetical protein JWN70_6393 [Planctomycetaceae bacterium]|nr:hypothetical protein [Planctomycetaceae bacterium]